MPTVLTHAVLPLVAVVAVPPGILSRRLVAAGMIGAVLPDADLIGRLFGIPHTHDFGHRGATHTLAFSLLLAAIAALNSKWLQVRPAIAFAFIFLCVLSHPLTDMLTDGGKGIMLFWPIDATRLVWPLRPVEVSPILLRGFDDGRIWSVLLSEFRWLILPSAMLALILRSIFVSWPGRSAAGD